MSIQRFMFNTGSITTEDKIRRKIRNLQRLRREANRRGQFALVASCDEVIAELTAELESGAST